MLGDMKIIPSWQKACLSVITAVSVLLGGLAAAPAVAAYTPEGPEAVREALKALRIAGVLLPGSQVRLDFGELSTASKYGAVWHLDNVRQNSNGPIDGALLFTIPGDASGKMLSTDIWVFTKAYGYES